MYEKLYAVCAAVIICNYLLMTVASRVLMAAFGRIPEKFFFLGIGILCLTGYLIAGISISKALFDNSLMDCCRRFDCRASGYERSVFYMEADYGFQ